LLQYSLFYSEKINRYVLYELNIADNIYLLGLNRMPYLD